MKPLAWITVFFTFLLMVWGNMVSATGSGLACPDWPLCHGSIFPPARFDIILEWGHRLLAFVTSLLILLTILKLWWSSQRDPSLKNSTRTILGLLVVQVLLGGLTVFLELSIAASTIHLLIACLVFGGLLLVAMVTSWGEGVQIESDSRVRRHSVAVLGALLLQLALGALVRHGHAGLACPGFPNCLDGFLPIPFTFETAVAFIHRWWGVLLLGAFFHLFAAAKRARSPLKGAALVLLLVAFFQVSMGIGTVMSGLGTASRGIHAAIGYAMWALAVYIALRAGAFRFLWRGRRAPGAAGKLSHEGLAVAPR